MTDWADEKAIELMFRQFGTEWPAQFRESVAPTGRHLTAPFAEKLRVLAKALGDTP